MGLWFLRPQLPTAGWKGEDLLVSYLVLWAQSITEDYIRARKGEEDKADRRRRRKTTSGNGQALSSPSLRGQWRTDKNRGNWSWSQSSWVPQRPSGLRDRWRWRLPNIAWGNRHVQFNLGFWWNGHNVMFCPKERLDSDMWQFFVGNEVRFLLIIAWEKWCIV